MALLGTLAVCLAVFMPGVNAIKNRYQSSADNLFLVDICYGTQTNASGTGWMDSRSHGNAHALSVVTGGSSGKPEAPQQPDQPDHPASHSAECLYCGFFAHNLPLLHSVALPAASYGVVSRIARQHQHPSYYARPAFVPLSRAPPVLS